MQTESIEVKMNNEYKIKRGGLNYKSGSIILKDIRNMLQKN